VGEVYVQNGAVYYGNDSGYRLTANVRPIGEALVRVMAAGAKALRLESPLKASSRTRSRR
jgi:hypothetical protein